MRNRFRLIAAVSLLVCASASEAVFTNGGFEQNSFAGWTLGGGTNPGLAGAPPFTGASVQINPGATGPASLVGATADPRAPGIVLPRVGRYTAKINDEGTNAIVTTLRQTDTVTAADIDPADGLPHLRFSFAPVLDDPSHSPEEQPYFYVVVRNVADNSVLFEQFAYSGQPGVTFQQGTGTWKFLPFQNVDAVLPAGTVGQQIELTVIGADCSLGGHAGYVYVDGFGSAQVGGGAGTGTPAVPVPALDRLGMLLMALLLAGCGLFSWRRA
ncbi:hypothetical protein DFR29_108126 [Tahibacter aquaticus]|uniref:Secreted protein n=1 Tax=Tahibacter aquaticus TaxID=520092 RepID=A0A4R6YV97_9GAMM|nr:hypothetical protein [Tahibacter aquaticus]TDR42542.1 hypothetical protein DFR29_108126 [Tahibacter aquaticus]